MSLFDSLKRLFGGRRNGASASAAPPAVVCEEALRRVHEFIDGELEDVVHAEVEAHFEVCKRCYPHLRLERSFREALQRACGQEAAPSELRERVLHIVSGESDEA